MSDRDQDPVVIPLTPEQWEKRVEVLKKAEKRRAKQPQVTRLQEHAKSAENSVVLPAANVWVCHGVNEYAEFTDEEIQAVWPDEAIWERCPPQPVIGWRVSRGQLEPGKVGETASIVLVESEFEGDFTESAFGHTPDEAVQAARRLLSRRHREALALQERCASGGHMEASFAQDDNWATCHCGERRVRFVLAAGPES